MTPRAASSSSRIATRFEQLRAERRTGLVPYLCAGDPDLATTRALVLGLVEAGADVIELGVPFTDPLADGPSIQRATERALASGTTLPQILALVGDLRRETEVPLLLMTYFNPVDRYGLERTAREAADAGVDGFLITDLPPDEAHEWKRVAEGHGLDTIFMLTPTSTPARVEAVAQLATGFVYCVSRTGVTGARPELPPDLPGLIERIRAGTTLPIAVGFGISRPEHVRQVGRWAEAAVVGSALVDVIGRYGRDAVAPAQAFLRSLRS